MDWFGRLFDITKLPSKVFVWMVALTAAYLFLPPHVQLALHLDGFPKEYKTYAGALLVAAASFLAINCTLWIWNEIRGWFGKRAAQVRIAEAIAQLDHFEKAVLREFFIQGKHVIELPFDHPTVAGLLRKRILSLSSTQGYRSLAGLVSPVTLGTLARELLEFAYIDFPLDPTDADIRRLHDERPNFVQDIERHDRLRGGLL